MMAKQWRNKAAGARGVQHRLCKQLKVALETLHGKVGLIGRGSTHGP